MDKENLRIILDKHDGWVMSRGEFGAQADLSYCDLSGADLRFADLRGALLSNTNLTSSNLFGALLVDAYLSEANLYQSNLEGAHVRGADLGYSDLRGSNFRGTNLDKADLRGACMTEADLAGAYLNESDLVCVDLSGGILKGAKLKGANLTSANLHDCDLTGAILAGVDLTRADLARANLTDTHLCDAEMSSVNLTDVNFGGIVIPAVDRLDGRILEIIESDKYIDASWLNEGNQYGKQSRAGWAVMLAGREGAELEERFGTSVAAALIYHKSSGYVPDFLECQKSLVLASLHKGSRSEGKIVAGSTDKNSALRNPKCDYCQEACGEVSPHLASEVEGNLDSLLSSLKRKLNAEYAAAGCQTRYDFDQSRKAGDEYDNEYEKFLEYILNLLKVAPNVS